jgi:hypothetical protein
MAGIKISDGTLKGSVSGTEKIPVSGVDNPVINSALIAAYTGTALGVWVDYVPTFGGFSTPPTITIAKYCKIGNLCFVVVVLAGTSVSNATTFTITLPFAAGFGSVSPFASPVDNGSSVATGSVATAAASNVATLSRSTNTAWTASGIKRGNFSIFYITE